MSLPYQIEEFQEFHEGTQRTRTMVRVTGLETGRAGTMRKDAFEGIRDEYTRAGLIDPLKQACASVVSSSEAEAQHSSEHIFHVWINAVMGVLRTESPLPELEDRRDLYEWKSAMEEVRRLPGWIEKARVGTLPTHHRQCSRSPVEELPPNNLVCALGRNVLDCPILQHFYETWEEETARPYRRGVTEEHAAAIAAKICTWHIFTAAIKKREHGGFIDTSEGYMQDEGDRQFWSTVYANLSAVDEAAPEPLP